MKEIEGPYFDVDRVGKYLGISMVTVYRLLKKKNGIPAHRIGGNWQFIKDEIEQWVRNRR